MRKRQSNYIICFILTFLLLSMNIQVFANTVTINSSIDNENITSKFKDKYFKEYVYKLIGKSSSKPILYGDVKSIKIIDLNPMNVIGVYNSGNLSSLSGMEYFTALTTLDCSNNQLTTLDVSKNTRLTILKCSNNKLATLDVSKNTALTDLSCYSNKLTTLNVSKNKALTYLDCNNNQLTTLDVSKNIALDSLDCFSNQLTTLDVSKNTKLITLQCCNNKLATLDVSKNISLNLLDCFANNLTTLDVSKNTALGLLDCYNNQITTLYSIKDTWNSTSYRPQYIDSTRKTTTDSLVITIVTAKAEVLTTPKINYLGVDHSPLVVGDTEKFTVTSKYDGLVQYRAFIFDGKTWNELTSGYGEAVDAKTPYVLPETSPFKLGKYKLSVWVKRAGEIGGNSSKNYDAYYTADLNCVTRDNANRVYANGAAKVENKGLTVKINGIENIDGIKGPYLYRLFVFNPTSGIWSNGAKEYTESPSYTFDEAGTYMVIVHANTVNSTTWKNYIAGKTKGAYEAWKTVVVTVKNEKTIKVFDTTVKTAQFGATVNVTLTAEGVKNFATATKYQIFDGTKAISAATELGKATTVFPAKASGDKVSIKLLDASTKEIKEIEVLLGESGTI